MADINLTRGGRKIHKDLYMTDPKTVAIASGVAAGSFTINTVALIHTIVLKIPDFTSVETVTISIENSNSDEIYSAGGLARDATHNLSLNKPLVGNNTVKLTLTGTPGDNITPEVTLYLRGS